MDLVDLHLVMGLLAMLLIAAVVGTGWTPNETLSEAFPPSVRENPSSYSPSHVGMTGWHPVYVATGGGYRSGTSTGGGFTSGK